MFPAAYCTLESATFQPLPRLQLGLAFTGESSQRGNWPQGPLLIPAPWATTSSADNSSHALHLPPFSAEHGAAPLCPSLHSLCKPTPPASDQLHSRGTAEQPRPKQTNKLLCSPLSWTIPSPIRSEQAFWRGGLPSFSFFGYSPSTLQYHIWFPYRDSFIKVYSFFISNWTHCVVSIPVGP